MPEVGATYTGPQGDAVKVESECADGFAIGLLWQGTQKFGPMTQIVFITKDGLDNAGYVLTEHAPAPVEPTPDESDPA